MNHRGEHMKMNFDYFQITKLMSQTASAQTDEKVVSFACFLLELCTLNFQK